ncbi:MAG: hypothetical protein ACREJP_05405 [Candidatus Methylomirabilales bacterium]
MGRGDRAKIRWKKDRQRKKKQAGRKKAAARKAEKELSRGASP